ncbi:MAG TPA: 5,10-methylenetetrahydromethanopterin reductase [Nitrososphaerales archaeon]
MVKFGIEFVPQEAYWKTTYYAMLSEKSGYDYVWITDHFNNRNVYIALANILNYTDRVKIGPGVTNPYVMHPVGAAQAMATLAEMAPGRVVCGLGTGDKTTLDMVNIPREKPLATIRESVKIIKEITSGKRTTLDGEVYKISGVKLNFKIPIPVPVFVGAQGPKMLSLAAEVSDGALINASNPKDFESAFVSIKEGLSKAGRSLKDIEVVAATAFSIDKDKDKAREAAAPVVAFIVAGCPEQILARYGIPVETASKIRDAIVKGDWGSVLSNVNSEMMEAFSIYGTPDVCVEKISQLEKMGVTIFITGSPIGPKIHKSIELFSKEVLPHFKN